MDNSNFFSVDHRCNINVHPLTEGECVPNLAAFELEIPEPFKLSTEVAHIDAASLRCLRNLGDASEELTDYLKMQAQKIDVLLGYVLSLQDIPSEQHQTSQISASGLSYHSKTPLPVEQAIRLKIFLASEGLAIYCYAKVIACEASGDSGYQLSVQYSQLRVADQEHLIRATLHIQTQQLKLRQRGDDSMK